MFNLGAIGAGLGQFAEQYQKQQEAALRQQQMKLQMAQFQQNMRDQQQLRQAQAGIWGGLMSGAIGGDTQPIPGQTLGSTQSGGDLGGGLRAGGALTGDPLDLIAKYESGGKNIEQNVLGPRGGYNPSVGRVTGPSSASGPWQMVDPTWRSAASAAGIDTNLYPRAINAPVELQRKAAQYLYDTEGLKPWAPYNSNLRAALLRGGGAPQVQPASYTQPAPQQQAATESPMVSPPPVMRPQPAPSFGSASPSPMDNQAGAAGEYGGGQAPTAMPGTGLQKGLSDEEYRQQYGQGYPSGVLEGRRGAAAQPQQAAATDVMAPVRQEVQQGIQSVAKITPPSVFGKMGIQGLARQIEKAMPDADPAVKYMALQEAQTLLAPDAKMQWEAYKEQRSENFQKEMALFHDRVSEGSERRKEALAEEKQEAKNREGGDILTDPTTGQQYLYNKYTKKATTLAGEDYTPGGAQRLGGGGASPLSADRAKDLATETSRLDKEYMAANPLASESEKQQAHFQNRSKAEKVLAEAKSSTARQSPRTVIFRKAMEEHPEATAEELQTYYNNQVLNEKITASFGNGDAAKQMRAINTVADHILRVQDYAEALRNGDIPRANQLANVTSKELGHGEVTTFEAGRDIMTGEVGRLLTTTGGTKEDRERMIGLLSTMMSPEQFAGVFGAFKDFSGARFEALRQQFSHNDPKREAEFSQFLTPAARKVFEGMKPAPGVGAPPPASAGASPGAAPTAAPPPGRRTYRPGEVIEKGGKRYRVTGGDPSDPDVEEIK